MAERCICCGKKIGLLNGSHLNNQVCDSCYFPIAGYLSSIRESSDIEVIDENYNQFIQKVQSLPYSENGKEYLVSEVSTVVNDIKNVLLTKFKMEQIRKDFKITTTNNFEEYKISKYYGITSGSAVLGTGLLSEGRAAVSDALGIENESFSDKLEQARSSAIDKIIDSAIRQGGNALIGVSFDYINFSSNMIGVVVNGTVVKIVKQDSPLSA